MCIANLHELQLNNYLGHNNEYPSIRVLLESNSDIEQFIYKYCSIIVNVRNITRNNYILVLT